VHDYSFHNPTFSLLSPPSRPSFLTKNNNIYKSDIPKPDPTKVKRLAFNVITSLQENIRSMESGIDILRDKIDDEFKKFDEKHSKKYEQLNKKLGITEKKLENIGKNFLCLYNKFVRVEKIVDEDIDNDDDDNNGNDEEEEPILNINEFNQLKY
jgi:hypothetical protein